MTPIGGVAIFVVGFVVIVSLLLLNNNRHPRANLRPHPSQSLQQTPRHQLDYLGLLMCL